MTAVMIQFERHDGRFAAMGVCICDEEGRYIAVRQKSPEPTSLRHKKILASIICSREKIQKYSRPRGDSSYVRPCGPKRAA